MISSGWYYYRSNLAQEVLHPLVRYPIVFIRTRVLLLPLQPPNHNIAPHSFSLELLAVRNSRTSISHTSSHLGTVRLAERQSTFSPAPNEGITDLICASQPDCPQQTEFISFFEASSSSYRP